MSKEKGRLFVISAPSGAGKDTLLNCLLKQRPSLVLSVSATTRAPRPSEKDGQSYYFVTRESFLSMIEAGEFLEHAEYIGEFYGTPKRPIKTHIESGHDVILEIEVQGARQIALLDEEAVTIFIVPPSMDELERRLRHRGTDSEEKLAARLDRARLELEEKQFYMHVVVNDDIKRAVDEIVQIIDSYRDTTSGL